MPRCRHDMAATGFAMLHATPMLEILRHAMMPFADVYFMLLFYYYAMPLLRDISMPAFDFRHSPLRHVAPFYHADIFMPLRSFFRRCYFRCFSLSRCRYFAATFQFSSSTLFMPATFLLDIRYLLA